MKSEVHIDFEFEELFLRGSKFFSSYTVFTHTIKVHVSKYKPRERNKTVYMPFYYRDIPVIYEP